MAEKTEEISDVEVVLKSEWAGRNQEAVAQLQQHGLTELELDDANGVVEGTIETQRVPDLRQLDCVSYVRIVMSYVEHEPG